jgi:hypothetical protein
LKSAIFLLGREQAQILAWLYISAEEQLQEQALTVARTHFLKGAGTENSQPLFREKQGKDQHLYHPFSFYERSTPRYQPGSEEQAHLRFKPFSV